MCPRIADSAEKGVEDWSVPGLVSRPRLGVSGYTRYGEKRMLMLTQRRREDARLGGRKRKLSALVLLTLIVGACGSAGPTATPEGTSQATTGPATSAGAAPTAIPSSREFVMSYTADISGMDPAKITNNEPDWTISLSLYNSLARYDWNSDKVTVVPDLAEKWDISTDGLVYTFNLRHGVQFQKGFGELTSADVVYQFQRAMDPATKSLALTEVSLISKVEAVDTYTVRFTLKQPNPDFLTGVIAERVGLIPSMKAVQQFGADYVKNPIGTGPYSFVSWTKGQELKLEAFADYFRGAPAIKKAKLVIMTDPTVATLALQSDQVQAVWVRDAASYKTLKAASGVTVVDGPSAQWRGLNFNMTEKWVGDLRVRQALTYAIDQKSLADSLGMGMTPGTSFIPPGVFGHTDEVTTYSQDLAKAKQLLADAGFPADYVIRITTRSTDNTMAQILQGFWAKIGVQSKIIVQDATVFGTTFVNWDVRLSGLIRGTVLPYVINFGSASADNINPGHYKNSAVDELIAEQAVSIDATARAALLLAFQRIISDDLPIFPAVYGPVINAYSSSVTGAAKNVCWWRIVLEQMSWK